MKSDTITNNDLPIVCDPNALTAEQRERWMEIGTAMYKAVQEIEELPNGYALRLPGTSEMLILIAEDLTMDRLCCPFLSYTLEIQPDRGSFWLKITGSQDAKAFLKMSFEVADLIDEAVARAAGFDVAARTELDSAETAVAATHALNERFASTAQSLQSQEDKNG
jgi:hypothetical protein